MLGQLQMKMIDIQTSLKKSTAQVEGLKREIQRSKLTDKEINTLNNETRMYSSVGRMYESSLFISCYKIHFLFVFKVCIK